MWKKQPLWKTSVNFTFRCHQNWQGKNNNYTGWWFQPTPLKNMFLRQLGWWHSHYMEKKHVPNHQPVMVDWLMFFFAEKQALSLVKALWLAENGAPICQKTIMITTDHLSGWNATIRGALKTHQNCLETGFQGFNPEGSWSSRNINISVKIHILTNSSTLSV